MGQLLREHEAAEYLRISVYLLQRWRTYGGGPHFIRVGGPRGRAIRYEKIELDQWIKSNRIHREVQQ
jgi:hypothetical protein